MSQILIVEDEGIIRSALRRLLERNGFSVTEASTVPEARDAQQKTQFDLIISDLRLPGAPGTELIQDQTPVLIMTSYASLRSAIDTMKQGAVEYIAKPFDHDEMLAAVNHTLSQYSPKTVTNEPSAAAETAPSPPEPHNGILGESPPMQRVFKQIRKVAAVDTRVLILGESGTGKELVARALHDQSPRHKAPMISVNCAAIPETLIESELFGHEKGAFTGANASRNGLIEAADGGTLFLDEIGELPIEAQARLLRVLQEKEIRRLGSVESRQVDVRIIAATHRDLERQVDEGRFRLDLYYRLNVVALEIPPLRERGDDVILLAEYLLDQISQRLNVPAPKLGRSAREALLQYTWPGNVRELENIIERAIILSEDKRLQAEDLHLPGQTPQPQYESRRPFTPEKRTSTEHTTHSAPPSRANRNDPAHLPPNDLSLEDYFVRFVQDNQEEMSETELARKLGISRKCLWERRQRLGIPRRKTATGR
ncbi:Fis family transcriptional regulator [Terasakiispira papahanaumokuakeensis]|uniref:Fis family transcriptional regulator n=1 Tax=Terasakiispira papahanaumokuakeensis TaxID=197479 RepID=A0A1E2VCY8_9GAMM|nr:sigma-54 dependent transcriptional regulator [Terasakiispira papahanaumokuakeensis]ODC04686.1 Fis family transcriptional regulator [Terasakiispira papahanaumokuakeensis]